MTTRIHWTASSPTVIIITIFLQNRFGWEYWQYNALMCGVVLILLFLVAHKNTKNIALFFSMFLIYPFVDSVMQKRFFYAFILSIIAILCQKNRKYKTCIFAIVFALGFHFSAIIMIPYLLMDIILKRNPRLIWIILAIEVYVLSFQRGILNALLNANSSKVQAYMTSNISIKAGIMFIVAQCIFVILTLFIENKDLFFKNIGINARDNFIMRVNIFSLIFLPLLMMDAIFFRYYRIIMVVSYFELADRIDGSFLINDVRYYLTWLYIVALAVFQIFTISSGSLEWNVFLDTMFKYNQFLKAFGG